MSRHWSHLLWAKCLSSGETPTTLLNPRLSASLSKKVDVHLETDQVFEEGEGEHMNKTGKGPEREDTEKFKRVPSLS